MQTTREAVYFVRRVKIDFSFFFFFFQGRRERRVANLRRSKRYQGRSDAGEVAHAAADREIDTERAVTRVELSSFQQTDILYNVLYFKNHTASTPLPTRPAQT